MAPCLLSKSFSHKLPSFTPEQAEVAAGPGWFQSLANPRVCVSVPATVPKTTAEMLKHKINPSAGETFPHAVDVLLYTPGTCPLACCPAAGQSERFGWMRGERALGVPAFGGETTATPVLHH